jgi:type II secretory pathway pseudopilin PulG
MVNPAPRRLRAFTILELLMVFAIIVILTSMIIASINHVRQKAMQLETANRMESVLNALSTYNQDAGQVALALQIYCNLGGVQTFANIDMINNRNFALGGSANPKFIAMPGENGAMWPNGSLQNNPYWDRILDVMPPQGLAVSAAWYDQAWPYEWPDSDWQQGTLNNPPILRFPWGRPGLRLDGTPCDPSAAATTVINHVVEFHDVNNWMDSNYGDPTTYNNIPVPNAWIGYGSSFGTSPYTWTTGSGGQFAPVSGTITGTRSDGSTVSTTPNMPVPYDLGLLSPMQTVLFLQIAQILPPGNDGVVAYHENRSPKEPWNDSWGNPLVVAYAIFQPERFCRTYDAENRRDLLLKSSLKVYGFNRAVYLSVGALGIKLAPSLNMGDLANSSTPITDAPLFVSMWKQITRVCNAATWTEASFANPPWHGVNIVTSGVETCFLTNPIEVH